MEYLAQCTRIVTLKQPLASAEPELEEEDEEEELESGITFCMWACSSMVSATTG